MKVLRNSLVGMGLVVLVVLGSANAATQLIEWSFDGLGVVGSGTWPDAIDDTPFVAPYEAVVPDSSGGGRDGFVLNSSYQATTNDPMELVPGLYGSGDAVRFGTDHLGQSIIRHSGVSPLFPAGAFSTGASIRCVFDFAQALPSTTAYDRVFLMQLGTSGFANDSIGLLYDNDSSGNDILGAYAEKASRYLPSTRAQVEAVIGRSMIGAPVTLTVTYDNTTLALYADGMLVNSVTNAALPITATSSRVEVGNDASGGEWRSFRMSVDEFALWGGALTGPEALADYQSVVPEPATIGLLAVGLVGLIRRRRA